MSVEDSLDFAFNFAIGKAAIRPAQIRSEIAALLQLLTANPPRRILEIGTAGGGTMFLLSRVATMDARLMSIDLPGSKFGAGYGPEWIPLLRALPQKNQDLRLVRTDSHDLRTREHVVQWLEGTQLDFLLVDGDHSCDGVCADFEMYGPLVRPGGLIAFHDIAPGEASRVGGVPHYWQAIRHRFVTYEFVEDWKQGGFGIGIIEVPSDGIQ